MEEKKEPVQKQEPNKKKQETDTKTCVCNMEWRSGRGDEETNDCICYPEDQ